MDESEEEKLRKGRWEKGTRQYLKMCLCMCVCVYVIVCNCTRTTTHMIPSRGCEVISKHPFQLFHFRTMHFKRSLLCLTAAVSI